MAAIAVLERARALLEPSDVAKRLGHDPVEFCAVHGQVLEAAEHADRVGEGARDVRVGQVERLELGHRLVEARDGAADLGPLEVDLCDAVVREALCGQRAGDIVGTAEDQLLELLALAQLLRHAAREVDLLEDEQLERRGDLARQRARDARLLGGDDLRGRPRGRGAGLASGLRRGVVESMSSKLERRRRSERGMGRGRRSRGRR
mmetsp:Transcript_19867/g.63342  ORF Transcript_19867/g.63342 Transcript_19867/m.63342 type:complete len:205 (-) Transcript_19867:714-1328(-)